MIKKLKLYSARYIIFFIALFIMAFGIVLTVISELGVAPWTVFHTGVALRTGINLGRVSQITGLFIIVFSLFLGIKPTVGTVLNMYFIGFFIDLIMINKWIPVPHNLLLRWFYLVIGIIVFGIGTGIYLNTRLGSGPRDSLMLGLASLTSWSISRIRTFLEITVLILGYLLGGQLGIGTLVYALMVGHVVQWSMKNLRIPLQDEQMLSNKKLSQNTN